MFRTFGMSMALALFATAASAKTLTSQTCETKYQRFAACIQFCKSEVREEVRESAVLCIETRCEAILVRCRSVNVGHGFRAQETK